MRCRMHRAVGRSALPVYAWLILTGLGAASSGAQEPTSMPADTQPIKPVPTVEAVQERLKQATATSGLPDEVRARAIEHYQQALADLQSAAQWQHKAAEFDKLRQDAPALLEAIRAELAQPPPEPKAEVPPDVSLQQLEQKLAEEEARLKAARDRAAALDQERTQRGDRRAKLPEQIAGAREKLAEVSKQAALPVPPDEPGELTEARRTALQARRLALEAEIDSCEKEVASYDARGGLLTARRDRVAREVAQAGALVQKWQEVVNERRRLEAERAAAAAKRDQRAAALQHPALRAVAEENAEFAKRRADLAAKIERTTAELDQAAKSRAQLTAEFTSVRSKVEVAGLTHAMGQLLRQKREQLPDVRRRQRALAARKAEISAVQVAVIELEDARDELADLDQLVQAMLVELDESVGEAERREIEAAAQELFQTRRGLVEALLNDCNAYFAKIVDLDAEEQRLIREVEGFAAYIDERVLWIQSTTLPKPSDAHGLTEALGWLVGGGNWAAVVRSLGRSALASPAPVAVGLPAFLALLLVRRRLRSEVRAIGKAASKPTSQAYLPTVRALLLSALIAVTWPAVVAFVGWRLSSLLDAPDFVKAVAAGLATVAVVFVTAELFRQVLAPKGLAECHFAWPAARVRLLRRQLLWLMAVGLPIVFVVSVVEWTGASGWQNTLGRLSFVIGQLILAVAARRLLKPDSGVFKVSAAPTGRLHRARHLWYVLGVGLPLLLSVLATVGYYYTALQLANRLLASVWLILTLVVADALALRWLLVSRRKLAMEQARQRRAAAQTDARERGESTTADEVAAPQLDLSAISIQTRNLLFALGVVVGFLGLWFIWVDVLPALNILNHVHLWSIAERPVTLGDLALALLTLVVASIATKNLPGLLEIAVLQHLPFQPGERYAITTTARYVIIIVAVSLAASAIGVGWSKVQWLVAAMTVGLGFGLQEIFANFVSGLIILFERPIRMGDVVTVGNVTGRVSRIRTRATTIIDWDCKELVIPNKEFVTGQVVNWSLSDQVLRLVVRVGIAYGSDTRKARETLLGVARNNARVLSEPKPKAFFQEFGESSLNFELRTWVKDIDDWMVGRHELHQGIDDAFRDAGIEIAFPQRDIHVRSIRDALPVINEEAGRMARRRASGTTGMDSSPEEVS